MKGDAARGKEGSTSGVVGWKRVRDIYDDNDIQLFGGNEIWSTLQQGKLGNCYYLSTLVALDSRPGALEELFVVKKINR